MRVHNILLTEKSQHVYLPAGARVLDVHCFNGLWLSTLVDPKLPLTEKRLFRVTQVGQYEVLPEAIYVGRAKNERGQVFHVFEYPNT